ncbi:MAG: HEPN domain-containing protein [Desulfurococcus sp.]|nr:HEPN domain-containing protein [Desulfurococcus sp.]
MAREDLSVAYSIFNSDQHAASVFYAELASQKAVKALIAASGFEPGKTHRPTVVLKALISSRIVDLPVPLLLLQLGVACSIWSRGGP